MRVAVQVIRAYEYATDYFTDVESINKKGEFIKIKLADRTITYATEAVLNIEIGID